MSKKNKRIFYRVVMPKPFANREYRTLEAAQTNLQELGAEVAPQYVAYWKDIRSRAKIVKVTEIIEEI